MAKRANSQLKKGDRTLLENCKIANQFHTRFLGLMGKKKIADDAAVVFPRCTSIHTFFMRFPIDVVFVDGDGKVVSLFTALKPWRLLLPQKSSKHCVEMAPGRCRQLGIEMGSVLTCEGAW